MIYEKASVPACESAPALIVSVPRNLQYCVTLGATTADAWREVSDRCVLAEYLTSMATVFSNTVAANMAAAGNVDEETLRDSEEAFITGFLGRVQQWLGLYPRREASAATKH